MPVEISRQQQRWPEPEKLRWSAGTGGKTVRKTFFLIHITNHRKISALCQNGIIWLANQINIQATIAEKGKLFVVGNEQKFSNNFPEEQQQWSNLNTNEFTGTTRFMSFIFAISANTGEAIRRQPGKGYTGQRQGVNVPIAPVLCNQDFSLWLELKKKAMTSIVLLVLSSTKDIGIISSWKIICLSSPSLGSHFHGRIHRPVLCSRSPPTNHWL